MRENDNFRSRIDLPLNLPSLCPTPKVKATLYKEPFPATKTLKAHSDQEAVSAAAAATKINSDVLFKPSGSGSDV